MKKIIAGLLLVFMPFSYSYGYDMWGNPELTDMRGGQELAQRVDLALAQMSDEELSQVEKRLDEVELGVYEMDESKIDIVLALISYIRDEINQIRVSDILESSLSEEKTQEIQEHIMLGQTQLQSALLEALTNFSELYGQQMHLRETGDMSMDFSLSLPDLIDMKASMSAKDYEAVTHNFEQELNGKIEAVLQASMQGENIDIALSSLVHYIMSDGNIYLLLENLSLKDNSDDTGFSNELAPFIEKLSQLARENTYLKISDGSSQEIMKMLESFDVAQMKEKIDTSLSLPLLEAYAESGDEVLLRPTRHACNLGKQMISMFASLSGSECSDEQYNDMLSSLVEEGISFRMLTDNSLMIQEKSYYSENSATLVWNETSFDSLQFVVTDMYGDEPEEMFSLEWKNGASFDMEFSDFFAQGEIHAILDSANSIESLEFTLDGADMGNASISYKNGFMSADIDFAFADYWNPEENIFTLKCSASGRMGTEIVDLTGNCLVGGSMLAEMNLSEDIEIDSTLEINTRSPNNNIFFSVEAQSGSTTLMEMNLENTGTRQKISESQYPISLPEKSIDLEDFESSISQ